jgi:hypothetical protein
MFTKVIPPMVLLAPLRPSIVYEPLIPDETVTLGT